MLVLTFLALSASLALAVPSYGRRGNETSHQHVGLVNNGTTKGSGNLSYKKTFNSTSRPYNPYATSYYKVSSATSAATTTMVSTQIYTTTQMPSTTSLVISTSATSTAPAVTSQALPDYGTSPYSGDNNAPIKQSPIGGPQSGPVGKNDAAQPAIDKVPVAGNNYVGTGKAASAGGLNDQGSSTNSSAGVVSKIPTTNGVPVGGYSTDKQSVLSNSGTGAAGGSTAAGGSKDPSAGLNYSNQGGVAKDAAAGGAYSGNQGTSAADLPSGTAYGNQGTGAKDPAAGSAYNNQDASAKDSTVGLTYNGQGGAAAPNTPQDPSVSKASVASPGSSDAVTAQGSYSDSAKQGTDSELRYSTSAALGFKSSVYSFVVAFLLSLFF